MRGFAEELCGVKRADAATAISAPELAGRIARGEDVLVVDVREPHELAISSLAGALHMPLATVPQRAHELPLSRMLVLMCHRGSRSQKALEMLSALGFTQLRNLSGGIDAWSREVDPKVPRY